MSQANGTVRVVKHPLVQDRLTKIRDIGTDIGAFRQHMSAIASMLFYEASRDLPLSSRQIKTPLETMQSPVYDTGLVLISVLRAGLGFLDGILPAMPTARVGYLGLSRNPETLQAQSYYSNLPEIKATDHVFVLDPMLATGHTLLKALEQVEKSGAKNLHVITLLASPNGIAEIQSSFPKVNIVTASIDASLNEKGYIVPGLGDAGDRLYGTAGH